MSFEWCKCENPNPRSSGRTLPLCKCCGYPVENRDVTPAILEEPSKVNVLKPVKKSTQAKPYNKTGWFNFRP